MKSVFYPYLLVFLSSELDEESRALQALLSTISKPVVSIHFCCLISFDLFSNSIPMFFCDSVSTNVDENL